MPRAAPGLATKRARTHSASSTGTVPPPVATPSKPTSMAERIQEIERTCRQDFKMAAAKVLKIKPKDAPIFPFVLNWPQQYVVDRFLQPAWDAQQPLVLLILKARQDGISTLGVGWTYHKVRWYRGMTSVIAAHQDDTVANLYDMARRFHDTLPPELQPKTDRLNRKELHYIEPIDSSLRVRAAKYLDISRGKTPQIVHISEIAYLLDPDTIMSGLLDAVPSSGPTLILLEGTAAGVDTWHYDLWKQLGKKSKRYSGRRQWARAFLPWYWGPDKQKAMPPHWDFPVEDRTMLREMQQRFQLRDEQIMWYWSKLQEKLRAHGALGKRMMLQENPSTASEAFITAGESVFPEEALELIRPQIRNPIKGYDVTQVGTWQFQMRERPLESEPSMLMWEDVQPGYQYALGIDVSRGVGRDASAIVVVRMPGFTQIAHWHDTHTSTKDLAYIIAAIAVHYARWGDRPICTVELNDAGLHTNVELSELAADLPIQLYLWEYLDRLGSSHIDHRTKTGWTTNVSTKPIMLGVANSLLLAGQCDIPSEELQADMARCQEILRGAYQSFESGGCDLAIAYLLAIVTAWRKIARWQFPGLSSAKQGHPIGNELERVPEVFFDRTWAHRVGQETQSSMRAGDNNVSWLVQ